MPDTRTRPAGATTEPAEFTEQWHREQEAQERAWLDEHARAQNLTIAA